ncbi:MAG: preprotein translocase subunit YajC [Verrucomicrobia bacterium]|nr:preprotein translocase subunit YajC [Verrucomicrobiota bacterium]
MSATEFFAQTAAPAAGPGGGAGWQIMVFYALIAGGFYFLFIAPQRKKQKELEKMLASLESGDEVITTGGIFGVITNVKDDRFVVRVSEGTKIEVGKGFIQSVTKKHNAPSTPEKK